MSKKIIQFKKCQNVEIVVLKNFIADNADMIFVQDVDYLEIFVQDVMFHK